MWTPPQNHWGGLWLIKKRCTDYFSVRSRFPFFDRSFELEFDDSQVEFDLEGFGF